MARKAVGRVAQEAIEEAMEDVWKDAAINVGTEVLDRHLGDADWVAIGDTASDAVEVAMTAADVASRIDNALDVADAAKKVHKATKTLRKVRR